MRATWLSTIRRVWRELREPAVRCARLGHTFRPHEREILYYPSTRGGCFDRCVERCHACRRCGEMASGWWPVHVVVHDAAYRLDHTVRIALERNGKWLVRDSWVDTYPDIPVPTP